MKQIEAKSIQHHYMPDEYAKTIPIEILVGEDSSIRRGNEIEREGSKGVIFDLEYFPDDHPSENYKISIFWYLGPESVSDITRSESLTIDDFLKLRGIELLVDGSE